jgi:23S rRNA pseudouridine2605 synthase
MDGHQQDEAGAEAPGQDETTDSGREPAGERIAKVLARAGVASRREVERLIVAGRVALNGETLTTPAVKVSADDRVTLDGRLVAKAEPTRLFRYHKPTGLVTTHSDPKGRPTVFETLPPGLPRVISVGRLDLSSEGLLLLTNDGELARRLELPATGLVRRYRARARGLVDQAKLDRLKNGTTVEGVRYGPIEARLEDLREGAANQWIVLTLAEGKNREVRRVLESLGLTVNRLIRLNYGPYELGDLKPGEVEELPAPGRDGVGKFRRLPTAKPGGRDPTPLAAPTSGEAKKTRKPGWARPKFKASGHKPSGHKSHGPGTIKSPETKPARAKSSGAKPSGSRPARGPPAGPRGPKPSASPPGSSPARRPGPRPGNGPKRRG